MKLSVKSDYAARAILGLARHFHNEGAVRVETLAQEEGIPANYLVQILLELKTAQIVKSVRGKDGGYLLARPPAAITLADVLIAIHGHLFEAPALDDDRCPPELRQAWRRLQESVEGTAHAINFHDLVEAGGDKGRMFYI